MLLAFLATSCQKDLFSSHNSPSVNADIAGQVLDENNEPISGAQVRVDGELAITDANGVFRFASMRVPADNATIMVSKIGYYDFSRALYVASDALQTVTVKMLAKTQTGTISGANGGSIQLPDGTELIFPAGAFADDRGSDYNGTVRVYGKSVNPKTAQLVPGDGRATNREGAEMSLGHYGVLGVELFGQSGQELRIRQGAEVTIKLPIPAGQLSSAPSQVSLWYYNLQEARWVEDGVAERVGNTYVGTVNHFTFWSFSTAFNLVTLEGKVFLVDNQHPMKGVLVRLTMASDSTKGIATTNANGFFKGGVPKGESFILEVVNECDEVIHTLDLGQIDDNTVLPDILVANIGSQAVEVTGKLVDCSGAPIPNGYAQVLLGNFKWVAFTSIDGTFSISKLRCDTTTGTGVVIGFDLQNDKQSAPDTITVPPNSVALGDLAVCDSLYEFIKFSLDFNDYTIAVPVGGVRDSLGMRTFLSGYSTVAQNIGISMEFDCDGNPGSFPLSNLYVNTLTWNSGASGITVELVDPGVALGDPITGTFDGTFVDQLGLTHTLSGSFQVRRDY
ncbi:MAG: carboxypeptidase regulatory-like domain-containing protein [Chitinophagales bacterium]|nr:carboxypeptidase regulatory-like domain-containing protein [Chitinophagales bacterium]